MGNVTICASNQYLISQNLSANLLTTSALLQAPNSVQHGLLVSMGLLYSGRTFQEMVFSPQVRRILEEPNAGGNSSRSEAISMHMLENAFSAVLEATETDITYFRKTSITDYCVSIQGIKYGVSVTRAIKFGTRHNYTEADAERLLIKKLRGVLTSTETVCGRHTWDRQILHIFVETSTRHSNIIKTLRKVYQRLPGSLRSNTIVIMSDIQDQLLPNWLLYQ